MTSYYCTALKILPLLCISNCLILVCFCVGLFGFILLEFHWASWICRFMSPLKFGMFLAITCSNSLCPYLSLFSSYHNVCIGWLDHITQSLKPILLFFFFFFSFLRLSNFNCPIPVLLIFSSDYLIPPSWMFKFCYCIFQFQNFYSVPFFK